jgi:hypothetical protein
MMHLENDWQCFGLKIHILVMLLSPSATWHVVTAGLIG